MIVGEPEVGRWSASEIWSAGLWRRRSSCLLGASAGGQRRGPAPGASAGASAGGERGGERRERARGASAGGEVRWAAAQSARAGGGGAPSVVARGARKGIKGSGAFLRCGPHQK